MPDANSNLADVLENPEWTEADFAAAKPFAEVFPDLARKMRDAQEAMKKASGATATDGDAIKRPSPPTAADYADPAPLPSAD